MRRAFIPLAAAIALIAATPPEAVWAPVAGVPLTQQAERHPESAALLRRLIAEQVAQQNVDGARRSLARLAAMGYALSPATQTQLGAVMTADLRQRFSENGLREGAATLIDDIPAALGIVESVVIAGDTRIASGVTAQDLLVSRRGGEWRPLGLTGLGSLIGLALDAGRGQVWAAAGVFEQTPRREGAFRGLIAVDTENGAVTARIAAPEGVNPGDIALAADGTLYASDPLAGGLYRAGRGSTRLERIVGPELLRSPQGIAIAADGRLYVSDYMFGIALVDPRAGTVTRLPAPANAMLDGIDGLFAHRNRLIAIQNGTSPLRVIALDLSADDRRVESQRTLWQRPRGAGEPTTGMIAGAELVFVANADWEAGPGARADTRIERIALR